MNFLNSHSSSGSQANDEGSVLTEFAIVLPLLVVFFLGISGLGQLLGHVTWISQTTYAAAMFAADVPQADGAARVEIETARLKEAQSRGQVAGTWDAPVYFNGGITGKPIVSVSVPAHVSPFMRTFFATEVGVSVAAPYLVPNQAAFAGFGDFGNPQGAGCSGASCNPIDPPYIPGIKELDVRGADIEGFPPVAGLSEGADNFINDFQEALKSGSSYEDLMEKFGESEYMYIPEVGETIKNLAPKDGKSATTSSATD